jgi:riboflavin kinase/FMN adenylyltransferase
MEEHLSGKVTRYKGNGRLLGYPTANFTSSTNLSDGVYFGIADLMQYHDHPALIFIGVPLTMGDKERRVEVHLLDIDDKDYYGQPVSCTIMKFKRSNKKFENIHELKVAMKEDEEAARTWFKSRQLLS